MNKKNIREEKSASMEQRISEAAIAIFVRKGFAATSMSDVAEEANIGRTSLHYYYRTKDMLFEAMVNNFAQHIFPNIEKIVKEDTSVLDKIPKILDIYFHLMRTNPALPLFVINEINRDVDHILTPILKNNDQRMVFLRLRALILQEMDEGKLRKQPIEDVASTFISLIIFPFLIKNMLLRLFMEEDQTGFNDFLDRKRIQIEEIMTNLLSNE